jgi:hypothetical protein
LNDCPQWAAAGDCDKNKAFMTKECPRSCKACDETKGQEKCENRNQLQVRARHAPQRWLARSVVPGRSCAWLNHRPQVMT